MFNLGGMEILVILAVALLVLGPDKLPNFMRTIGKAVGELRRASTEFQRTIHAGIAEDAAPSPGTAFTPEQSPARTTAHVDAAKPAAVRTARGRRLPRVPHARRRLSKNGDGGKRV
jgi:sec-independent protein translocase protein TatB